MIYNPKAEDNEEQSASVFQRFSDECLGKVRLPYSGVQVCLCCADSSPRVSLSWKDPFTFSFIVNILIHNAMYRIAVLTVKECAD